MPRFAANLSLLYTDRPFLDRFAAARASGFRAVEFQFAYAFDPEEVRRAAADAGVEVVLFNLPAGDWERGERGIAVDPARREEFREGVERAVAYARALHCPRVNCLAGIRPADVPPEEADRVLADNLRLAAERLAAHNVRLLTEPVNPFDIPGFHLNTTAHAVRVLEAAAHPNLGIQYDIYHAQRTQGELVGTFERLRERIGHIQVADNPGRHEPGTGEIAYRYVFEALDRLGYAGWIGLEYIPAGRTEDGLAWVGRMGFVL
ncbi:MAG: hydroxypyruvate isomerase [Actinomycetia bacterium]|nr:hydroxypyruvate isomerase [Actinomycetes bacterium]